LRFALPCHERIKARWLIDLLQKLGREDDAYHAVALIMIEYGAALPATTATDTPVCALLGARSTRHRHRPDDGVGRRRARSDAEHLVNIPYPPCVIEEQPRPIEPEKEQARVGLIVTLIALGASIIFGGYLLPESWSYWSGVAGNVGTTLLLASALVFVERYFFRRVATTQAAAASNAAAEAVGAVEQRLETRLVGLDTRLADLKRARDGDAEARIERLDQDVSFRSLADALRTASEANSIGAVGLHDMYQVVVPAGSAPASPRIGFAYRPLGGFDHQHWHEGITLTFLPGTSVDQTIWVDWRPDETLEGALSDLIELMRSAGEGMAAKSLNSPSTLVANLRQALTLAMASKRGDENGWLQGRTLAELLWNGWAVTDAGLQRPDSSVLIVDGKQFPAHSEQGRGFRNDPTVSRPEGLSDPDWETLLQVIRSHFFFRAEDR